MGKETFIMKIKNIIASIGFTLFLWGNNITKEQYFETIYFDEKNNRISKNLPL